MKIFCLATILVFVSHSLVGQSTKDSLLEILQKLDQIKSATYTVTTEAWAPGDTKAAFTFSRYCKEYSNPADQTIGASFINLLSEDTTKMSNCYDGKMQASVNWNQSIITMDSFKTRQLPFRPVSAPFFNYTASIIRYILETKDPIKIDVHDIGDSLYVKLIAKGDKQLEFFGRPYFIEDPASKEQTSQYEIWINKSKNLPYRVRRELSHDISVKTCRNVKFNTAFAENFLAANYLPADFTFKIKGQTTTTPVVIESQLVGKAAPDWVLLDSDNKPIALKDLRSKVLLIHFTSVSCGPCKLSISLLKQLATAYSKEEFDIVSVESFTRNSSVLKTYQERNDFKYKFLRSTDEVTKHYDITLVPVFYLLDQNRIIRKVVLGYNSEKDKEIRNSITELLW